MISPIGNIKNLEPYQPGKTIEEIKKIYKLDTIIKLASNENAFGTSPKAIEAVKNNAAKLFRYPDGSCKELKKKIAKKFDIKEKNIVLGNGSNEIIELIFRAFIEKNNNIITCYPTFSFYKICASTTFGKFLEVPLRDYKFSLKDILKKIDKNTKIVIICNPNNPTGTIVNEDELEYFINKISEDILIVLDEAYIEFVNGNYTVNGLKLIKKFTNKNIITLRTFSKIYGLSALRIGYGIANESIINYLNRVRQPFNVNGIAQVAAIAALDDIDFYKKTIKGIEEGKNFIYKNFDKLNIKYLKSETNFIFFELNCNNNKIFEMFLKKGVIIRSLKSFGYNNALRVTVGTKEENEIFIKALKQILNELKLI